MNREIKFRAWADRSDEYSKVKPEMKYFLDAKPCIVLHPSTGELWFNGDDEDVTRKFEGKITLMQFTGLTDKHGVKIFEGDIIKNYYNGTPGILPHEKEFCSHRPMSVPSIEVWKDIRRVGKWEGANPYYLEVIGNIFEHAHLLETK